MMPTMTTRISATGKFVPLDMTLKDVKRNFGRTKVQVARTPYPIEVIVVEKLAHELMLRDNALRLGNGVVDLK